MPTYRRIGPDEFLLKDGDGNPITSTDIGADTGLDVNVIGGDITIENAELAVEIDAADGDNIAIKDVTGTNALDISAAGAAKVDGSAVTQPISASTLPLPTGASTSALQTTGNASLSSIDGKITTTVNGIRVDAVISDGAGPVTVDGTVSISGSVAVTGPLTDAELRASAVPISAASLPLPTNAATETTLAAAAASLSVIDDWDESDRAKINPIVGSVGVQGDSGVVSASTQRVVLATDVALPAGTNNIGDVDIITMPAVTISGTVPISAVALPLPAGAATSALQTQPGVDIGDVTVNNAAGVAAVNIQDGGNSITVDGIVSIATNSAVNVAQVAGTATSVNAGSANAGTLRVVLATDQPQLTNPLLTRFSPEQSYAAASLAFTPPATPTDVFTITGSASKTVNISRIFWHATSTAATVSAWFLLKRSTANTAGTATTLTNVPVDSANAAATATVLNYTANPTLGTVVGRVWAGRVASITASPTNPSDNAKTLTFNDLPLRQPITLRGVAEVLALNFNGAALPSGLSVIVGVEWTES